MCQACFSCKCVRRYCQVNVAGLFLRYMYQVGFSSKYVMHILQEDGVEAETPADESVSETPAAENVSETPAAENVSETPAVQKTKPAGRSIRRTKPLRKPRRQRVTAASASATAASASATADAGEYSSASAGEDSSTAEEVILDPRLLQSEEVQALEGENEYQSLKVQTAKQRIKGKKQKKFHTMRSAIRKSAKAAREAYILGRESQPDTPDVREMLQVNAPGVCIMYAHSPPHMMTLLVRRLTPGRLSSKCATSSRQRAGFKLPRKILCYLRNLRARGSLRDKTR